MSFKKFDLIVANGDSFTDGGGVTEQWNYENPNNKVNKIAWAEFLSKKLDIPLVNIAEGGSSNDGIIRRAIDFIEKKHFFWHNKTISKNNFEDLNVLFITQWSYLNRIAINLTLDNSLNNIQIINVPEKDLIDKFKNNKSKYHTPEFIFENIKNIATGRVGLSDYRINSNDFILQYFMFNNYLKTKTNITHLNWFYTTFDYVHFYENRTDDYALHVAELNNTTNLLGFDKISPIDVYMGDCKTVWDETNGKINDMHIGLHSNEMMAERLYQYLKKQYGIQ